MFQEEETQTKTVVFRVVKPASLGKWSEVQTCEPHPIAEPEFLGSEPRNLTADSFSDAQAESI